MATLLVIHRPGDRSQRCDARCYDAHPHSECLCVCGGVNHAAGRERAMILTREQVKRWIAAALARDPDIDSVEVSLDVQATPLF